MTDEPTDTNTEGLSDELALCRQCNNAPKQPVQRVGKDGMYGPPWQVSCGCGCAACYAESKEKAIEAWNALSRRAANSAGGVEEVLQQVRNAFNVEYDANGKVQAVGYDSNALRPLIALLDAALSSPAVEAEPVAHPDDIAVDQFAAAMKAKLAKKRGEGRSGWEDKEACSASFLSSLLHGHVSKGDPVDVANLAMMLHQRGEAILQTPNSAEHDPRGATFVFGSRSSPVSAEVAITDEMVADAMHDAWNEICSDTGCHPLDIERHGKELFFHPLHWARLTAMCLRAALNGGRENG